MDEFGDFKNQIETANYGEFGDVKYITVPADDTYKLSMVGIGDGTFSLDIQELLGDEILGQATAAEIPVELGSLVTMEIKNKLENTLLLSIDENGDGIRDFEIPMNKSGINIYEEPASAVSVDSYSKKTSGKRSIFEPPQTDSKKIIDGLEQNYYHTEVLGEVLGDYDNTKQDALATETPKKVFKNVSTYKKYQPSSERMNHLSEILYNFFMWVLGILKKIL